MGHWPNRALAKQGMGQTGHWPNRALAKQGIGQLKLSFFFVQYLISFTVVSE